MAKTPKTSNEIYTRILERVLNGLEQGTAVWRMPWTITNPEDNFTNPISEVIYQGQNRFLLMWAMLLEGWNSPHFATYKQITSAGGQVIKGSTGVPLVKYFPVKETRKEASERLGIPASNISDEQQTVKFLRPSYFTVFNLKTQTTGLENMIPEYVQDVPVFTPIERAEQIMEAYADKPEIRTDKKAAYYPVSDYIGMPPQVTFDVPEEYYSTLFHEAGHSTGHSSRLNRTLNTDKSSKSYAIEELIVEFGASILCGVAGIDNKTLDNSVAYIASWKKQLTENPDIVFKAMNKAIQAADYIQGQCEPETVETA